MRALSWGVMAALLLLAGIFAVLTMAAFAALSAGAPLWLRSLGTLEAGLFDSLSLAGLPALWRALLLSGLTSSLLGLAAYVKPRH